MRYIAERHLDALFVVVLALAVTLAYACTGGAADPYPRPDDTTESCDRYAFSCGGPTSRAEQQTPLAGGGIAAPAPVLPAAQCAQAMPLREAAAFPARDVVVRGTVAAVYEVAVEGGTATYLQLGDAATTQDTFTVAVPGAVREQIPLPLDVMYLDRAICASGSVRLIEGRPQILVGSPDDLAVAPAAP